MTLPSQPLPTVGQPNSSEDPKVRSCISEIQTILSGNIGEENLSATLLGQIGTEKGASIINTSQGTNSTTFTTLSTPDRVTITVAATSILYVSFRADVVMNNASSLARTSIYVGGSQGVGVDGLPVDLDLQTTVAKVVYTNPAQNSNGYLTYVTGGGGNYGAGIFIPMVVAAGTYAVEARFKTGSSGTTITASNRSLYVKAESFA